MIDPAKGWYKIVNIPNFELYEVTPGDYEYIDKLSASVRHMFNKTWLSRYPRPKKIVFDNGYDFKQDLNPLLKDFNIKAVLTTVKKPQANYMVERIHQVILNMIVTKDIDKKVFDHIDQWGENLAFIALAIRASYHHNIMATPGQAIFGRYMLFNLASVFDWQVVTAAKQCQVEIDNVR